MITVTDKSEHLFERSRIDDFRKDSTVCAHFSENKVLIDNGKIKKMDKILIRVTMKEEGKAQTFSFTIT